MATKNRPGISLLSIGNPNREPYNEELLVNKQAGPIYIRTKESDGGDIISFQNLARLNNTVNRFAERVSTYGMFDTIMMINPDVSANTPMNLPFAYTPPTYYNAVQLVHYTDPSSYPSFSSGYRSISKIMFNFDIECLKVVDNEVTTLAPTDPIFLWATVRDTTTQTIYNIQGPANKIHTSVIEFSADDNVTDIEVTELEIRTPNGVRDYTARIILHSVLMAVSYH